GLLLRDQRRRPARARRRVRAGLPATAGGVAARHHEAAGQDRRRGPARLPAGRGAGAVPVAGARMTPDELREAFARGPVAPVAASVDHGVLTVDVEPGDWVAAARCARDDLSCDFFDWLTAVDELDRDPAGLRVVLHVYSTGGRHHL